TESRRVSSTITSSTACSTPPAPAARRGRRSSRRPPRPSRVSSAPEHPACSGRTVPGRLGPGGVQSLTTGPGAAQPVAQLGRRRFGGRDRIAATTRSHTMDESDQSRRPVAAPPGGRDTLAGRSPAPSRAPADVEPPAAPHGRREEILDGAAEMFAEHGYHGSSLRDISQHIGISHSGMLHHFGAKDVLLDAVIDRMEEHAQAALDRIHEIDGSREIMMRGLAAIWHPASLPIRLLATLDAERVSEDPPGRFRLARLPRVHEHMLEPCFASLAAKGLLREGSDPAFAGRALLA